MQFDVRPARVNALLGTELDGDDIAGLLEPLGIDGRPDGAADEATLQVTVPTYRPDIRPAPAGEADIAEEVARTYGYSRITRRTPSWPQPGRLTTSQRDRRLLKEVLCGLGADEAWTATFLSGADLENSGFEPPYVEVTNPLVESEPFLRTSMAPGLVRTVMYNAERRQGEVRLFEVGSVFRMAESTAAEPGTGAEAETSERLERGVRGRGRRRLDGGGGLAGHRRRTPGKRLGAGQRIGPGADGQDAPFAAFGLGVERHHLDRRRRPAGAHDRDRCRR